MRITCLVFKNTAAVFWTRWSLLLTKVQGNQPEEHYSSLEVMNT